MKTRFGRQVGAAILLALVATPGASLAWQAPDIGSLPDDAWGRTVREGQALIVDTARLIGPLAEDPQRRFAGNTLSCQNCHLQAGTKEYGLPLVGVYADFPQYRAREGSVATIEDRINGCMTRSLNGRALPIESPEMLALVSYIKFLSTGIPIGSVVPGRGAGAMAFLDRAADPERGATIYVQVCAACHGADGAGRTDTSKAPPLWGADSFNDGAGMTRLITGANFIYSNMPNGTTWQAPALSAAEAWDVAAYLISQPRPNFAGQENDYPTLRQKPIDAASGPYADAFSAIQHRLGPFQPIVDARRAVPSRAGQPQGNAQ